MMLDLTSLQNRRTNEILYSDSIEIDKSLYENTDIRSLSPIDVNISIYRSNDSSYIMNLEVSGVMTLPCCITLKDVYYPFNIKNEVKLLNEELIDEDYVKINQNSIDIIPIIWQNILLEIPLKVTSDDTSVPLSGEGWKLVREE